MTICKFFLSDDFQSLVKEDIQEGNYALREDYTLTSRKKGYLRSNYNEKIPIV